MQVFLDSLNKSPSEMEKNLTCMGYDLIWIDGVFQMPFEKLMGISLSDAADNEKKQLNIA